jgi:TRAP-type uncharacterized transport system fused permease subunit
MYGIAAGMEGYMLRLLKPWERIMAIAAGLLLIDPGLVTDSIGFTAMAFLVILQIIQNRRNKRIAAV